MILKELANYQKVQDAARYTLSAITQFIKPGVSEDYLVKKCDELQKAAGVNSYWYKSLPALVLAGDRTTLAISSTPYLPSDKKIQENDLLTIDLNPSIDGYPGDMARTYYIEAGIVNYAPQRNLEFVAGAHAQSHLHSMLMQVAYPEMTFNELYYILSKEIELLGFEQIDYIGHTVQKDMRHLNFIAPNETCSLSSAGFFTLEPHICTKGGQYGFKHENIYYFKTQTLQEL